MSQSALDIIMGAGGYPSAEFPQIGAFVGGEVVGNPQGYHAREFDRSNPGRGALKYYPSGDPVMGVTVDVKVYPPTADDPGIRRLYIEKPRQKAALRDALNKAGAGNTGIEPGSYVGLTWTGEEAGEGASPAKTWEAVYQSPAQLKAQKALGGATAPVAPVPQPQAQAVPQYQPQPVQQSYAPAQQYPAALGQVLGAQPIPQSQAQPVPQYQPVPQAAPQAPAPTGIPVSAEQYQAMINAGIDVSQFTVAAPA